MRYFKKMRLALSSHYWALSLCLLILPGISLAATTANPTNPWEGILLKISTSLTGPVAYAVSLLAIVGTGCTLAFADLQGGMKRGVQVGCGLSLALGASSLVSGFFGFSGAVI